MHLVVHQGVWEQYLVARALVHIYLTSHLKSLHTSTTSHLKSLHTSLKQSRDYQAVLCLVVPISRYYPLAKPKTKPAETLDTSGIPIFDNIPE